jgi:outer membrane biosynthesis protein TonB
MISALLAVALTQAPPAAAPAPVFSAESVQQVIEAHRPDVEACLQQAITERTAAHKSLKDGPVVVRFVLSSNGTVKAASVKRSVPHSKEFHRCLVHQILSWTFPKPNDGRLHPIEYPFNVQIQR